MRFPGYRSPLQRRHDKWQTSREAGTQSHGPLEGRRTAERRVPIGTVVRGAAGRNPALRSETGPVGRDCTFVTLFLPCAALVPLAGTRVVSPGALDSHRCEPRSVNPDEIRMARRSSARVAIGRRPSSLHSAQVSTRGPGRAQVMDIGARLATAGRDERGSAPLDTRIGRAFQGTHESPRECAVARNGDSGSAPKEEANPTFRGDRTSWFDSEESRAPGSGDDPRGAHPVGGLPQELPEIAGGVTQ